MVIPAVEGLAFALFAGAAETLDAAGEHGAYLRALRRHLETVLVPGACLFADAGWKLSSTDDNSWLSKVYPGAVRGPEDPGDGDRRRRRRRARRVAADRELSVWAWSDQIVDGEIHSSRYYPRGVTAALWLEEHAETARLTPARTVRFQRRASCASPCCSWRAGARTSSARCACGERACREAAALDADLALFPEMWQIGYAPAPLDAVELAELVGAGHRRRRRRSSTASERSRATWDGDRHHLPPALGRPAAQRRHAHRPPWRHRADLREGPHVRLRVENALTPGDGFAVGDLDTRGRTGPRRDHDLLRPRVPRGGAGADARRRRADPDPELRASSTSSGSGQFRARAFENMVGVAMANYATPAHAPATQSRRRQRPLDRVQRRLLPTAAAPRSTTSSSRPARRRASSSRLRPRRATRYRAASRGGDAYRRPGAYGGLRATPSRFPLTRTAVDRTLGISRPDVRHCPLLPPRRLARTAPGDDVERPRACGFQEPAKRDEGSWRRHLRVRRRRHSGAMP